MINKNSNKISGWIILDKQCGITSRQAVSKISKSLNVDKIGHGGTLDPLATGILPIAIGEATKLISFIQNFTNTLKDQRGSTSLTREQQPRGCAEGERYERSS